MSDQKSTAPEKCSLCCDDVYVETCPICNVGLCPECWKDYHEYHREGLSPKHPPITKPLNEHYHDMIHKARDNNNNNDNESTFPYNQDQLYQPKDSPIPQYLPPSHSIDFASWDDQN